MSVERIRAGMETIKKDVGFTGTVAGEPVFTCTITYVGVELGTVESNLSVVQAIPADAPDFVRRVTSVIMAGEGDLLPVSALPADGTYPTATARWPRAWATTPHSTVPSGS